MFHKGDGIYQLLNEKIRIFSPNLISNMTIIFYSYIQIIKV